MDLQAHTTRLHQAKTDLTPKSNPYSLQLEFKLQMFLLERSQNLRSSELVYTARECHRRVGDIKRIVPPSLI